MKLTRSKLLALKLSVQVAMEQAQLLKEYKEESIEYDDLLRYYLDAQLLLPSNSMKDVEDVERFFRQYQLNDRGVLEFRYALDSILDVECILFRYAGDLKIEKPMVDSVMQEFVPHMEAIKNNF